MYRSEAPAAYWRDQLFLWGPRVLFAVLILIVTHFVAKGVQWGVAKGIDRVPVLKRHPEAGGESIGTEIGRLAYWLVWLVGLIAALQQYHYPDKGGELPAKDGTHDHLIDALRYFYVYRTRIVVAASRRY